MKLHRFEGASAVMSLVLDRSELTDGVVVAAFNQKNFLRIKEGQYAEIALFGYPGQIFTGRWLSTRKKYKSLESQSCS